MNKKKFYGTLLLGIALTGVVWRMAWGESAGSELTFPREMLVLSAAVGTNSVDWQGLVDGIGREEVFYTCQACHSLMLVKQQRLSRGRWQEVLAWMVKEKGMVEPSPEIMERLLDYLSTHFGPPSGRPTGLGSMPPPLMGMRPL
ncbi:MAG: cytochrome c2 [Magnetococcales bacterium]|nr:cytochrome c2 [Magnetococcales bacterium]HIJ84549.1 hypothetical protein [Magnetococcales bacterium]